jgi:hypothetical protein
MILLNQNLCQEAKQSVDLVNGLESPKKCGISGQISDLEACQRKTERRIFLVKANPFQFFFAVQHVKQESLDRFVSWRSCAFLLTILSGFNQQQKKVNLLKMYQLFIIKTMIKTICTSFLFMFCYLEMIQKET